MLREVVDWFEGFAEGRTASRDAFLPLCMGCLLCLA